MGQGFSLTTLSGGPAGIDVPELSDLLYEKSMGNARFMKSIRARHQDGVVLVKVLVKPYAMKLDRYKKRIIGISIPYKVPGRNALTMLSQRIGRPSAMSRTQSLTNESSRRKQTASSCDSTSTAPCTIA